MPVFRFKQFSVDQSGCAMKVNTDGVLLGALASTAKPLTIMDIGSGTGVIALMLAQRFPQAVIDAVEMDEPAAQTATVNFENSVFADRLKLYPFSFERFFAEYPHKKYELIVSNPPFYINSLESPGAGRTLAKHAGAGFFELLISTVYIHLAANGVCCLILPMDTAALVKKLAGKYQLYLQQVISIRSYPASLPHREIFVLGLHQTNTIQTEFIIYKEPKQYTAEYSELLKDFLTIF